MLSKDDNDLICRVGPHTPMGKAMRHFWVPALMSSELPERDGDPVHVELLGENFVAFRDSNGKVGLLDEYCCHRGASLTIGRVEQGGLRCIYHGWLFAADGTVLETPNVQDPRFKERFKAKSYPVREAGGLVWAYLGSADSVPLFPDFPFVDAPANMVMATCQINACNYVQMFEGLLDSSHLSVLHSSAITGATQDQNLNFVKAITHMPVEAAPRFESEETDFGMHYAAIRLIDGKAETRIAAFISPFWALNPNGGLWVATVPMSDEKTAFYTVWCDGKTEYAGEIGEQQKRMIGFDQETLEAYGQTRRTFGSANMMARSNGYRQNREMMRKGHFSGVPKLALEDSLVCASQGPLRDRSFERLSSADVAIAHFYRSLLKSAHQVRDGGVPVGFGLSVAKLRGVPATLEPGADWRSLVPDHYRPERQLVAAE